MDTIQPGRFIDPHCDHPRRRVEDDLSGVVVDDAVIWADIADGLGVNLLAARRLAHTATRTDPNERG